MRLFGMALDLFTLWLLLSLAISALLACCPAPRGHAAFREREWWRRLFFPPVGAAALLAAGFLSAWFDAWAGLPEPCGTVAHHLLVLSHAHAGSWAPHELVILAGLGMALAVSLASLLRALREHAAIARLVRTASPARRAEVERLLPEAGLAWTGDIRVLSLAAPVCCVVGMLRPTLLLSTLVLETLPDTDLRAMLAHECAHAARRDNLWRLAARLVAICHMPGAAGRFLGGWSESGEILCDQAARERVGALATAEALVRYQRLLNQSAPLGLGAAFEGAGRLETRVRILLSPPVSGRHPWVGHWPWAVLLLSVLYVDRVHLALEALLHLIHQ